MKKRNSIKTGLIILVMGLLLLCSCYHQHEGCHGDGVVGSGRVVEEFRNVSYFDSIEVLGSCKLFFQKGPQSLRLVGEDNILSIIDTHVEGSTLVIDSERSYSSDIGVTAYVSMESVRGFAIRGAGKIIGEEGFTTDELVLEIFGAGRVELSVTVQSISSRIVGTGSISLAGSADLHTVEIGGAGEIDAYDLETGTYDITINGAGCCRIFVTRQLDVVIAGSGVVYYKGNPSVIRSNIAGAGKIVKI